MTKFRLVKHKDILQFRKLCQANLPSRRKYLFRHPSLFFLNIECFFHIFWFSSAPIQTFFLYFFPCFSKQIFYFVYLFSFFFFFSSLYTLSFWFKKKTKNFFINSFFLVFFFLSLYYDFFSPFSVTLPIFHN